ncbi:hypothetical protein AUJ17_02695 [Candidatus Micrarchaeota archaeon CG1_02_47_40]|nr:MAG: hypothetical protein AUJ17_02695 [Candidatus Micrarchaeota archaeon CG1_02_47_40]
MEIEGIAKQNPWWGNPKGWEGQDRHFRLLENYKYVYEREGYLPAKEGVVVLYGPRQIGKTTWIKRRIANLLKTCKSTEIFYLNAETVRDRFELYEAVKTAGGLYSPKYIFIDEINAIADWERGIKALVDEGAFEGKCALLSGSSSLNIMKKSERLPGRLAKGKNKYRFYPLSFAESARLYGMEFKDAKSALAGLDKLNPLLYRYFIHGGFIRAQNALEEKGRLDEELFSVYSAWIDGELAKVKKSPEITTGIMDGAANALTNETTWSAISRSASHPTIAEYVETLKDMFVFGYIEKSRRAKEGMPKNKKIYFSDPFLYWLALYRGRKIDGAGVEDLGLETCGKLAELCVYSCLVDFLDGQKQESDFEPRRYIHFERGEEGEIDFCVRHEGKTYFLESKFGKVEKEKKGVIYITKNQFGRNKIPLAVFLLHPLGSLELCRAV